jgi:hypothetical protein
MTAQLAAPAAQPKLTVLPSTLHEANAFVALHHRHHPRVRGCRFALAVFDEAGAIRGVAIAGRPKARLLQDRTTVEITRLATDGCPNACSALYAAAARVCRAMGFTRILTYLLEDETGVSLKAAGWRFRYLTAGGSWSRVDRPRIDLHSIEPKQLWEAPQPPGRRR